MSHNWKFFRAGGFDQVRLETADDLLNLANLDQKLWVALSCPVQGVDFDSRTMQLLDSDGDGYIRPPELLAAIDWVAHRLADRSVLGAGLQGVPVEALLEDEPDGPFACIKSTAKRLLAPGETVLTVDQVSAAQASLSASSGTGHLVLGENTAAAWSAMQALRAKLDDWFLRCHLSVFDERAAAMMNASDESFKSLGAAMISLGSADLSSLPLAKVDAAGVLPLNAGLNPAWAAAVAELARLVVVPLLGEKAGLSEEDWQRLKDKFVPYEKWLADEVGAMSLDAHNLSVLERIARYCRDLLPFANNLVSFRDFYTRQGKGMFQIGRLYLDGRAAELCVAVNDAARHAALAGLSGICLVYCDCVRDGAKQTIAAAFTAGDADQLMAGRNGVFYDNQQRDWRATITRIVDHPISLRQAFWSPYKRLVRLIGEQAQKMAGAKAKGIEDQMAAGVANTGKKVEAAPPGKPAPATPAQQAFDVGKFAGIFAAIGLALGALGTALASVFAGLLGLKWWQFPLVIVGLMLLISGPAVALAWFKLRRRTLGPILDANGWAVNARARINIPFGTALTQMARLPDGAERSLTDPYAEKERPWGLYLFLLGLAGGLYLALRYMYG